MDSRISSLERYAMELARHCIVNTIKGCAMKNKLYAILF